MVLSNLPKAATGAITALDKAKAVMDDPSNLSIDNPLMSDGSDTEDLSQIEHATDPQSSGQEPLAPIAIQEFLEAQVADGTMSPEEGHGARKLKSRILAGGEILTNPFISGLLINNCIETQAPNEKPATQQIFEFVLYCCNQSKTLAASLNSPSPSSYIPSLLPTPLKLKRIAENPLLTNNLNSLKTILVFIVPPLVGSG